MSEAEIIAALRQLATDLADFGPSPISKDTAMLLVSSTKEPKGGVLVQWWNRENDRRRKLVLSDAITLVMQAGYMQKPEEIPKAIEQLPRICDRLEATLPQESPPTIAELMGNLQAAVDTWNKVGSGAAVSQFTGGRKMGTKERQKIYSQINRARNKT